MWDDLVTRWCTFLLKQAVQCWSAVTVSVVEVPGPHGFQRKSSGTTGNAGFWLLSDSLCLLGHHHLKTLVLPLNTGVVLLPGTGKHTCWSTIRLTFLPKQEGPFFLDFNSVIPIKTTPLQLQWQEPQRSLGLTSPDIRSRGHQRSSQNRAELSKRSWGTGAEVRLCGENCMWSELPLSLRSTVYVVVCVRRVGLHLAVVTWKRVDDRKGCITVTSTWDGRPYQDRMREVQTHEQNAACEASLENLRCVCLWQHML